MLLIVTLSSQLYAQENLMSDTLNNVVNETVMPFCWALKAGDVTSIKQYLSGNMYEKNKVLLEQNKEYPEFLRNYYRGAGFRVVKAEKIDNKIIVDVDIEFSNSDRRPGKLHLLKDSASWKIVEFSM